MTLPLTIDAIYAWVVKDPTDPNGQEGIPASLAHWNGQLMAHPLVGADRARVESYRDTVQDMANQLGVPIEMLKFSVRELVDTVRPTPVTST